MRGDLFNNIILLVFSSGVLHGVLSVSEYIFVILPSSLSVLYSYKDADFINDNLFSSFSILYILLTKVNLIFHALVLLITIVLSLSFIALTIHSLQYVLVFSRKVLLEQKLYKLLSRLLSAYLLQSLPSN